MAMPVLYDPIVEKLEADEEQTTAELVETLRSISEKTFADYGRAVRSVHARSHGLIEGSLHVLPGLPVELSQGLFAAVASYPVKMRLSTTPGDLLDDKISTPRGLALKVDDVRGEMIAGETEAEQDFVLVNGPAFLTPSAKAFLKNLKLLAATTDKAEGLKKALSAALRTAEAAVEALGGKSGKLTSLGGHPLTHILGETFYSQAPILYGRNMAKISLAPVSPELKALHEQPVDLDGKPDGLREAVQAFFRSHAAEWELRVQLCTDLAEMPIEDSSVAWPEEKSPYRAVARISADRQEAWDPAKVVALEDGLAFSPWHCLAAHRPLGSIMRVRKAAYDTSAEFRKGRNECPMHVPAHGGRAG